MKCPVHDLGLHPHDPRSHCACRECSWCGAPVRREWDADEDGVYEVTPALCRGCREDGEEATHAA